MAKVTDMDWSKAPDWADRLSSIGSSNRLAWANKEKYQYCYGVTKEIGPYMYNVPGRGNNDGSYTKQQCKFVEPRPVAEYMPDIDWPNAPEWADRLMRNEFNKFWCSETNYVSVDAFKKGNKSKYVFGSGRGFSLSDFSLIHKRPIEDKEWLPKIGTTCMARDTDTVDFRECMVAYRDDFDTSYSLVLFKGRNGDRFVDPCWCHEFRPLKTQKEKDEESFIDKAYNSINKTFDSETVTDDILESIFRDLFGAGFTPPKVDE